MASNDPFKGNGKSSAASSRDPFGGKSKGSSKPKQKPKRWLGALVQDLEDFGRGLGPGFAAIGKAVGNDASQLVTGSSGAGQFELDDIVKGIGKDYVTRYKPLFTGHFKTFVNQVAKHPLDYMLDAATIATLGAGAAVEGGVSLASKGAKIGEAAAAAAPEGVFKAAGFVPRTAENVAAAERR